MKIKNLLILTISFILFYGCSLNKAPLFEYDKEGKEVKLKRHAKNMEVNYITKWSKTVYKPNNRTLHFLLSPDQEETIKTYGQPEYIRKKYISTRKDVVREWAYPTQSLLFQFVKGKLVYDGELTDMEKVLILYGSPDKYYFEKLDPDLFRESFDYHSKFTNELEVFHFTNGKLIPGQGPK